MMQQLRLNKREVRWLDALRRRDPYAAVSAMSEAMDGQQITEFLNTLARVCETYGTPPANVIEIGAPYGNQTHP